MTRRAWIIGLMGVVFLSGFTYFNDAILNQTRMVGNSMPVAVFGGLVLAILLLNPLLRLLGGRVALDGAELALIFTLVLAACAVPGSGLLRTFTNTLILPNKFAQTEASWKSNQVLDRAPPGMIVDARGDGQAKVLNDFVAGLGKPGKPAAISEVPWAAWSRPLLFWVPLLIVVWLGVIGFSLIVHRQWSQHEQLPYPIAQFANFLLPPADDSRPPLLRQRIFWIGLSAVFLVYFNNYLWRWWPDRLVEIPLDLDMNSLREVFPTIARANSWWAFKPTLYFTVAAFAYFLATDVSFSLGIGPLIFAYLTGFLIVNYGVNIDAGGYLVPRPASFLNFGAYLGIFLVLLYTGRHLYLNTLKWTFGLRPGEPLPRSTGWGAQMAIFSLICFVALLAIVGLDWQLAILYWLIMMMMFVVMGRIIAETGLFFIQPSFLPCMMLLGLFGAQALGPSTLLVLFLLSAVFMIDPREALMPFVINNLKIAEMRQLKPGKAAIGYATAVVLALAIALPATLYMQYNYPMRDTDSWAHKSVPAFAFAQTVSEQQQLQAQERLAESEAVAGFGRFAAMSADRSSLAWLALGLGLVLAFSLARLRFRGWPIHPVLFLIWTSYPSRVFAASFLVGWLAKVLVTKYGGARIYQQLKPLMIGIIAGEMLGGLVPAIIGLLYWLITKDSPKQFSIMPG